MGIYIAVFIILALMNGFFFYILKGITVQLKKFSKNNILRQASIFDELIQNKEETLQDIRAQLEKEEKHRLSDIGRPHVTSMIDPPDYLAIKRGDYWDRSFLERYRKIRDNFASDGRQCVEAALAVIPKDDPAKVARGILEQFHLEMCYQISTLESDDQVAVLREAFDEQENLLLEQYQSDAGNFECHEFLDWLRGLVFLRGGDVIVRTGRMQDDFNSIDSRIQTQYDDTICEGLYVVAKGKLYDFSIRDREISG